MTEAFIKQARSDLLCNVRALKYCCVKRGMSLLTLQQLEIGYVPTDAYSRLSGRIIFPIRNLAGGLAGVTGRDIRKNPPENSPRYYQFWEAGETRNNHLPYLWQSRTRLQQTPCLVVTEGTVDSAMLWQSGFAVACLLGTSCSKVQGALLAVLNKPVVYWRDPGTPGKKASLKFVEMMEDFGVEAHVVRSPDGASDPADFIRKYGVLEARNLVQQALYEDQDLQR